MTRTQIAAMWIFSSLISGVLVFAGVAAPLRARAELARLDVGTARSYWESVEISERRLRLREASEPNFYVGFAIPLVLIGSCTVLAVRMPSSARGARDHRAMS